MITAVKHKKAEINYKTAPKYDVPARRGVISYNSNNVSAIH